MIKLVTPLIKFYYIMVILAENKVSITYKVGKVWEIFLYSSLVAYVMDALGYWLKDNHQFANAIFITVFSCMVSGWRAHKKRGTFSYSKWFLKTFKMVAIMLLVYPMMDQITNIVTVDAISDPIIVMLQIATAMYPASKTVKNVHYWSNGKYPPEWLMQKLDMLEKTGDIKDFLKK